MAMVSPARPSQLVLRSEVIGRELRSIGAVRRAVDRFLSLEGVGAARQDVLLVVSELVTNSLLHTNDAPAVVVRHAHEPERIDIEVSDGSTALPRPRVPDADARGGRGLRIVDQLASAWGVRPAAGGKTTWASLVLGASTTPVPQQV